MPIRKRRAAMTQRRLLTCALVVLVTALTAPPGIAASAPAPAQEGLPNIDRRAAAPATVPRQTRAARRALERDLGPLGDVRTAPASGAVSYVGSPSGLLTGPSSDDPRQIALDYVRDHGEVFGLAKADVDNLVLVARDVSPDGITHLRFNQVLDAIHAFDSGLAAHVTRDGRLISVAGAPLPGAELATTKPALDALAGLGAARRAARGAGLPPRPTEISPGPSRITTFATGERARLRWSATAAGPVLAWQVITEGDDGHGYEVLVGARDGALLRRQDLTHHLGENRYFARDPDHTPVPTQVTMPPAWYDEHASGTRLWGQFSRTYVDPADEDPAAGDEAGGTRVQIPASGGAPAAPDWLYTQSHSFPGATPCPATGCTWNSDDVTTRATNQFQAGSNLHVLVSRFHDHLAAAPIGFDEAAGNFQRTNTSGQGLGGDYVRSEVNDGQGVNNANMSTPPDGLAPRMQMFLFTTRDANGSDIADIVYHEYGHGLSNRLVVNASGSSTLSSIQGSMMGEAWSDLYALDLLEAEGSVVDTAAPAEVTSGGYVIPGGVRRKPTDCPVDPAGIAGCNANGTATSVPGGYTYGDLAVTNNTTPHNGGEVWTQTLWDIRSALGRNVALALITGGMRLSAPNPSMLDMRDAILQQAIAMRIAPGAADDHYGALWAIFAARGMGANASTPSAATTNPTEGFAAPAGLRARSATLRDPYPGGDNDGRIEPGERFLVDQSIQGIGLGDLSGVTGTLSSTNPAVTIEDASAAWPLLGRGRSAVNGDELAARLPADTCATASPLTITVTSSEGGAVASARVDPRPASDTVVALADARGTSEAPVAQTVAAPFTVPVGGAITDVNLRIDELRHSFLGDLQIALVHNGVTVVITDRFGNANFAGDDIIDAIFDDEAAALPSTATAPITGRVRPAGLLSAFDGQPAAGTWTLRITDTFPSDSGQLRRWGLDSPQVPCGRVEIPAAATGSATGVGAAAATLNGSVAPNGRATGLRFSYGTTPAYGASTAVQDVGAGDAAVAGVAALTGLAASTTYHYRAEAIREGGVVAVAGTDATFTTAAADGGGGTAPTAPRPGVSPDGDRVKPVLSGLAVRLTRATRRGRRRATLRFRLSEPAAVKVVLTRSARGVRRGTRCVALLRKGRRCTRQAPAGTTTRSMKAGAGVLALSAAGLRRGSYTATLVATDAARNRSAARKVRFTVR